MGAKLGPVVFSSVFSPEDPKDGKPVAGAQAQIDRCSREHEAVHAAGRRSDANINHAWVFHEGLSPISPRW